MSGKRLFTIRTPFCLARRAYPVRGVDEGDALARFFQAQPALLHAARAMDRDIVWVEDADGRDWAVPIPAETKQPAGAIG